MFFLFLQNVEFCRSGKRPFEKFEKAIAVPVSYYKNSNCALINILLMFVFDIVPPVIEIIHFIDANTWFWIFDEGS